MQIKLGKVETTIKGIASKLNKNNRLKRAAFGTTLFVTILTASGCGKKLNDALVTQGFVQEQIIDSEKQITQAPTQTLETPRGYALGAVDGKIEGYDIDFTPSELKQSENSYTYNVYRIIQGGTDELVREDVPSGELTMVVEDGVYYAKFYNQTSRKEQGTTKTINTKELQIVAGFSYPNDENQCLNINYGYTLQDADGKIDGYDIDFTPSELQQSGEDGFYTYDVYHKNDDGIIERIYQGIPCGQVIMVTKPGEYFAVIINKETSKEYGVTKIVDTKEFGNGIGKVQNDQMVSPSLHR